MTTAALFLVLGTAVSTWEAVRATRAERATREQRDAATAARDAEVRARKRAEDAESAARTEADKATAINEFLVNDLLDQADPGNNAVTNQVTLLEVLDRAAEKVGSRFRDQPPVEAALRSTIGQTYLNLGAWEKSRQQYAAALAIYEREKGPRAAETAKVMVALGSVLDEWGRYDEAEPLLRQGLDGLRRALGEGHPDTLTAMNCLAHLLWCQENECTLKEAEALLKKVMEVRRRVQGENHPDTLAAMKNVAMLYDSQGKLWHAPSLHPKGLEITLRPRSEEYPDTMTIHHQAGLYVEQGRLLEAEALVLEALQTQRRVLGEWHPHTAETILNLVQLYHLQGKLPEAERLLVARLQFLRGAGAHIQYKGGLNIPYTTNLLAYNLLRQGRHAEAESLTRDLVPKDCETRDWFSYDCVSLRGGALLGQEKYLDAEPLLLAGYEGLKASPFARSLRASHLSRWRRLDEAGERIVQLYEAWGKPEKAAEWKREVGLADLPADVFARPWTSTDEPGVERRPARPMNRGRPAAVG